MSPGRVASPRAEVAAALLLLGASCASDGSLRVRGTGALDGAAYLEVRALTGRSCDDVRSARDAVNAAPLATLRAESGDPLSGQLPNERHIAYALLFNDACEVVATGCALAQPGSDVLIELNAQSPEDVGYVPEGRACTPGSASDAGPTDMQTLDADGGSLGDMAVDLPEPDTAPDVLEVDAADERVCASLEGCSQPLALGGDADGDLLPDEVECDLSGATPCCNDSDSDGAPDACDLDSDNDNALDGEECALVTPLDCPASRDPAQTLCDGVPSDFNADETCGSCTIACPRVGDGRQPTCGNIPGDYPANRACAPEPIFTLGARFQPAASGPGPVPKPRSPAYRVRLVPLAVNDDDAIDPNPEAGSDEAARLGRLDLSVGGNGLSEPRTVDITRIVAGQAFTEFSEATFRRCESAEGAQPNCTTSFAVVVLIEDRCYALERTVRISFRGPESLPPTTDFLGLRPGAYLYGTTAGAGPRIPPTATTVTVEADSACPPMTVREFLL
ncbi:MAG: hypothetical protein AAF411_07230 [Myxococcota bacterium]